MLIGEIAKHMKEATLPYKPFIESEPKEGGNDDYTGQKFYLFSTVRQFNHEFICFTKSFTCSMTLNLLFYSTHLEFLIC